MEDQADLELIASLGANIVESSTFEQNFIHQLEEHFIGISDAENEQELKEAKLQENEDAEAISNKDDAVLTDRSTINESSLLSLQAEEPRDVSSNLDFSGSSILRRVLEARAVSKDPVMPVAKSSPLRLGHTIKEKRDPKGLKISHSSSSAKSSKGVKTKIPILRVPENKETEAERQIRTGEMTPFGAVIEKSDVSASPKASFLNFTMYLSSQKALDTKWKKDSVKSNKKSTQDKSTSRSDAEGYKSVSKKPRSSETKALKYDVMFPKKRKQKESMGTKTSKDSGVNRQAPSNSASEYTSTYVNPDEDSDYKPPLGQEDSDDEWKPEETKRVKKVRKTSGSSRRKNYKEPDTDDSFSDDDIKRPSKKLKKESDDGDNKMYENRVKEWKANEIRFTGDFHTLHGGFKLPRHIWDSLYEYQKVGVNWLWELHQKNCGGILGDEMGLGKTIQIIAFLAGLSCSNMLFRFTSFRGLGPTLVVCPATVMHQWVKEFHTWWPPFRVVVLHESGSYSGTRQGLIQSVGTNGGVLITSFTGVVNSKAEILNHSWHYVILDEGHKIRNPDALVTLTVKQIPTTHRIICSGSPMQNNLKELWSLFDFVFPGKLGTLPAFTEQFAVPITQGGYSNASDIQVAAAFKCATVLRDIINPYLLRRMKDDVKHHVNLPPKTEQVLFCKLTPEQKACYVSYVNSREIDSIIQGRFNLFVGLINLRKICNHPHLFDGGPKLLSSSKKVNPKKVPKVKSHMMSGAAASSTLPNSYHSLNSEVSEPEEGEASDSDLEMDPHGTFGHWSKSGKMVVLETLLKLWQKQNHKVLLFSQSRQMLCILENFVRQQNYSFLRLDGSTSIGSRQPLIKKFNEDPSIFIFILTTKVGGLGVNLTGANRVIIFDPDWNPSTDLQARERAWRIGQEKQVTIYRLITSGTIEEKIYHRQIFKQFLTNRVLKDPKQKRFFKSNDMLELFSFNEGYEEKGTETEAIFAGTGSSVDIKSLKRHRRTKVDDSTNHPPQPSSMRSPSGDATTSETAREKSSGKFRGVPNLVKQRAYKNNDGKAKDDDGSIAHGSQEDSGKQDDYVLRKLFRKSGVEAALKHDKIVDSNDADYLLVEKEAERVATDAIKVLRKSREQCWAAATGRLTWTGNNGTIRSVQPSATVASPKKKLRIGSKKPATVTSAPTDSETPNYFTGAVDTNNDCESMSSAELVAAIKARKRPVLPVLASENQSGNDFDDYFGEEGRRPEEDLSHVKSEDVELLREIREFIAFRAKNDGESSTNELLAEFGSKLPAKESPLFKQLLSQLCSFRRVDGQGIWKLQPEFR